VSIGEVFLTARKCLLPPSSRYPKEDGVITYKINFHQQLLVKFVYSYGSNGKEVWAL